MHTRTRAFLIHFSASALVLGMIALVVLFWWYPGPMLTLQGGWGVLLVILTVDLVLGPSLTGLVYKPGKKWLLVDISVIVLAQIVALGYGVWSMHSQKPNYLAYTLDRFIIVPYINTVGEFPADTEFPTWRAAVRLTTSPTTSETTSRSLDDLINVADENIVPPLALTASDAMQYPPADMNSIRLNGKPVADIENAATREKAASTARTAGLRVEDVRAYQVMGRKKIGMALVSIQSGQVLDIISQ